MSWLRLSLTEAETENPPSKGYTCGSVSVTDFTVVVRDSADGWLTPN